MQYESYLIVQCLTASSYVLEYHPRIGTYYVYWYLTVHYLGVLFLQLSYSFFLFHLIYYSTCLILSSVVLKFLPMFCCIFLVSSSVLFFLPNSSNFLPGIANSCDFLLSSADWQIAALRRRQSSPNSAKCNEQDWCLVFWRANCKMKCQVFNKAKCFWRQNEIY